MISLQPFKPLVGTHGPTTSTWHRPPARPPSSGSIKVRHLCRCWLGFSWQFTPRGGERGWRGLWQSAPSNSDLPAIIDIVRPNPVGQLRQQRVCGSLWCEIVVVRCSREVNVIFIIFGVLCTLVNFYNRFGSFSQRKNSLVIFNFQGCLVWLMIRVVFIKKIFLIFLIERY